MHPLGITPAFFQACVPCLSVERRASLPRRSDARRVAVVESHVETLRRAIESLINAKLHDAISPGGLDRLAAHRRTGVASYDIRMAERRLEQAIGEVLNVAALEPQEA